MLERATGASPWASKELVPKILVPCCSHSLGLDTTEEQQGDYSCTQSGEYGVGGVTQTQERTSLSHRSHEGEEKASNSNSSVLSKGRGAPPGEAGMGRGELWTAWRAMPSVSFLIRHNVPKFHTVPPGAPRPCVIHLTLINFGSSPHTDIICW